MDATGRQGSLCVCVCDRIADTMPGCAADAVPGSCAGASACQHAKQEVGTCSFVVSEKHTS